jgi:hypothetical protein
MTTTKEAMEMAVEALKAEMVGTLHGVDDADEEWAYTDAATREEWIVTDAALIDLGQRMARDGGKLSGETYSLWCAESDARRGGGCV